MASVFVDDGYDRPGYIKPYQADQYDKDEQERDPLSGALSFTYRTATKQELIRHNHAVEKALEKNKNDVESSLNAEKIAAQFIVDRVSEWDAIDRKQNAVAITVDNMLRLHPSLFAEVYKMVRGFRTSDPKPDGTNPDSKTDDEQTGN